VSAYIDKKSCCFLINRSCTWKCVLLPLCWSSWGTNCRSP